MNQKNNLKDEIKQFVLSWNRNFPIDRWWREKHQIAFGSSAHKEVNFIQMFLEYEEDEMIRKSLSQNSNKEASEFFSDNVSGLSREQIDKDFDDLDLESFNQKV